VGWGASRRGPGANTSTQQASGGGSAAVCYLRDRIPVLRGVPSRRKGICARTQQRARLQQKFASTGHDSSRRTINWIVLRACTTPPGFAGTGPAGGAHGWRRHSITAEFLWIVIRICVLGGAGAVFRGDVLLEIRRDGNRWGTILAREGRIGTDFGGISLRWITVAGWIWSLSRCEWGLVGGGTPRGGQASGARYDRADDWRSRFYGAVS